MDPFSVTLGVVTLVGVCSKVGIELKKLRHGAGKASTNINAMLADLKALKAVLDSIEDGFEELDSCAPMTGFIGAHWSALKSTLSDGCDSMEKLEALLVLVNKDVKVLDTTRRGLRLKEANDQIVMYRQEIQAYKDALQLSLQSVIFYQQTTIKEDTSRILSSSENIHHDLNRLAINLDVKLTALEIMLNGRNKSNGTGAGNGIVSVKHLQNCVRTAATMVTSASTAMIEDEMRERNDESWDIASELGWFQDAFAAHADLTLDWVASQSAEQPVSNTSLARDHGIPNHLISSQDTSPPSSPVHPVDRPVATSRDTEPITRTANDSSSTDVRDEDQTPRITTNAEAALPVTSHKKRRNFSLSRLLSPRPKEVVKSHSLSEHEASCLCMNDISITESGGVRIKITFVGDGACGKTCFLIATSKGRYPEVYVPTVFENYFMDFEHSGVRFECALWDTAGQDDYDRLRTLSYPDTHIYCICFGIDMPDSLDSVHEKWISEIRKYKKPKDPIFLLGFKKDLRYDPTTIRNLMYQKPLTEEMGIEAARKIGAVRYLESSSMTKEGTKEAFETMLGLVLDASPELKERYKSGDWKQPRGKRWRFGRT